LIDLETHRAIFTWVLQCLSTAGVVRGKTIGMTRRRSKPTIQHTLPEAAEQLEAVAAVTDDAVAVIDEVVDDKGYHSGTTLRDLEMLKIPTYISEPDRGRQSWTDQHAERDAVYANRRRIRGDWEASSPQTR
jgi:transposase